MKFCLRLSLVWLFALFIVPCCLHAKESDKVLPGVSPVRMKVFGARFLRLQKLRTGCTMGMSLRERKKREQKMKRLIAKENSISNWLSKFNSKALKNQKDRRLFKNEPVSYFITFDGRSNIGSFELLNKCSKKTYDKSIHVLRSRFPIFAPPDDLPYTRGLIVRIDSKGARLRIAPENFRTDQKANIRD